MDRLLPRRRNAGLAPVRFVGRLMQAIYRARQRSRQRRALSGLNDAMLRDLGLSRGDVAREVEKPFWR
jgi:uncharacterized protein YjiS (DUF1127 family)